MYNFISITAVKFEVTGVQLTKNNIEDIVKFAGNVDYYTVTDKITGAIHLHLKLDKEGWFRVSEFDFIIKYNGTNNIYAYSPNVFFQYYKRK